MSETAEVVQEATSTPTEKERKEFERNFKALLAADLESKEAAERRETAKEPVTDYVTRYGESNRPEAREQRIVHMDGWKVQWTGRVGKPKVNEAARLEWCQQNHPEAIITKPVVSEEMWAALRATGKVPAKVLSEVEVTGTSYYLRWWLAGKASCPKCENEVNVKDAFCKHCGLKLNFSDTGAKKPAKRKKK